MKIPSRLIKKIYYDTLTAEGVIDVPVYDYAPRDSKRDYVWIQDVALLTGAPESKAARGYDAVVALNIVTYFSGNAGGYNRAEKIAEDISEAIGTKPYPQTAGIQLITCVLDSVNQQTIPTNDGILYVLNVRFRHQLAETNN